MGDAKKIKPTLSKGTRDFLPREVARRNYIFDTIKTVFRKYGFEEIETPAIERLETLTGKYGDEGDKLLFKILKSGDYIKDAISYASLKNYTGREGGFQSLLKHLKDAIDSTMESDTNEVSRQLVAGFSEKGLRYDLTVPLARYAVMYQDMLPMPFKRFHLGPVWRADRPQKGRYQEFYQCDADIIGSTSLLNEVELLNIYNEVFEQLKFKVFLKINSRKIIAGLAEIVNAGEKFSQIIIALDKVDKIEWTGVQQELHTLGLSDDQIKTISNITQFQEYSINSISDVLSGMRKLLKSSKIGTTGIAELEYVINNSKNAKYSNIAIWPTLARGLTYYTGLIVEVDGALSPEVPNFGSLGGGGRYDNLTEMFGGQNMSGVGISFGIERIYDVMEELNLFPETIAQGVKVLFVPREESMEEFAFQQVQALRDAGIPAEIYLGNVKKQKHFKYVEDKNIAWIVEVGENEKQSQRFRLRNAKTREMKDSLSLEEIIKEVE